MKKIVLLLVLMTTATYSQEFAKGKELFNANCAACHNMEKKMTGPPLQNVIENQGREWATKWISNSAELIKSGDAHANEIFKEYNEMAMPAYEYLKTEELSAIVDYLEGYTKEKTAAVAPTTTPEVAGTTTPPTSAPSQAIPAYLWAILILIVLVVVAAIVIIGKALNLLASTFDNTKIVNDHLMTKLNITKEQVTAEVETIFEKEVEKRVGKKVKSLKNDLSDKLKDFK